MSLMVFVGDKMSGYFAAEVAKVRGYDFEYVSKKGNIKEQINEIMFTARGSDFIIFDVEQYINPASEIADEVKNVCKALNAKPIIYSPTFSPGSEMARAMIDRDIKSFIFYDTAANMKDQLEKNMTGFFDANDRKEVKQILFLQEEEKKRMEEFTTVGVAGACHRMGTTTQAFQLVKYLQMKGYKACYIEMNSNRYIDKGTTNRLDREISFVQKVKSWFELDGENKELGMISCFDIDMFYNQDKIPEVLKKEYDYYVYDYGVYNDRDFNKTAFLREDVKIFIVGASPTELDYTKEIAQNISYGEAKLIFSLTDASEREDLLGLMDQIHTGSIEEGNGFRTYFAEYTPDPFTLTNYEVYEQIIPVEDVNVQEEVEEKSRFNIFKRKKKGRDEK